MNSNSDIRLDLKGKKALVTGGTRGIGKAIADVLLKAGAFVIITGTKQEDIDRLNNDSDRSKTLYIQLDLLDRESINLFLKQIKAMEKIDILINNAGINKIAINTETNEDDYDLLNNVNLKAPYLITREISRLMIKHRYGRIVNITSIWSTITRSGRSLYTLTKWGVVGLTKTLSVELAPYNILVNAIGPGFTRTELTEQTNSPEEIEKITAMIPIQRMAEPSEIANLALFLSSDLNSYLTGQNIIIDGGYTSI